MPGGMFTRFGYFVIIAIMVVAGAAIALVAWSAKSSDSPEVRAPTATAVAPAPARPVIPFERVIDFARLGAVLTIEAQGENVSVTFREDFDTSGFNTTSHVFGSSLQPGEDVIQVLEAAGIAVNGPGGVAVTRR